MEALYKNYLLLYGSKKILEYGNFFSTLFSSTKSYHIPRGRVKGKLKMEISIFMETQSYKDDSSSPIDL
jgi:hypothetical protein